MSRDRLQASYRYEVVLVLIVCTFTFIAAAPEADWARVVTVALQGMTLLAAVLTTPLSRRIVLLAAAVTVVAALAATLGTIIDGRGSTGWVRLETGVLVAIAPIVIVRGVLELVRAHGVTLEAVFGALAVYLLIGMLFHAIYGAIGSLGSGPFFAAGNGDGTSADTLYFSYATLSTVGYGDFTAASGLGRSLAILEGVSGQLYLVTVVALLVGQFSRGSTAGDPRGRSSAA